MALRINRASSRQLTLDWDARTIRVVAARTRGNSIEVVKAASIPIAADVRAADAPAFGRFLRDVLSQAGISYRHAVIAVPRDKVVLNSLALPPTPDDDLPAVVQFQIAKELPFAPGESTLDFSVRDPDPSKPRDVLVAAARNDLLQFYRDVAAEAGLKLDRLGLRPEANLLAVSAGAPEIAAGYTLIVDIGPDLTEIDILFEGRLVFSRAASVRLPAALFERGEQAGRIDDSRILTPGVLDLATPDAFVQEAVDLLQLEVTRSVEAFRATAVGAKFDRAFVAGATGVEAAFVEILTSRLGVPVELYNPGRALDLVPARARELRGFSAAIGLAMGHARPPAERIDFLQPKRTIPLGQRRMARIRIGLLAAAVLLAAVYKLVDNAQAGARGELVVLKTQISKLSKKKDQLVALEKQVNAIKDWLDGDCVWLDDLRSLSEAFPTNKEAYAQSLQFSLARTQVNKQSRDMARADLQLRTMDQAISPALIVRLKQIADYKAQLVDSAQQIQKDPLHFSERMNVEFPPDRRVAKAGGRPETSKSPNVETSRPGTEPVGRVRRPDDSATRPSASSRVGSADPTYALPNPQSAIRNPQSGGRS